jgi:hypothetical protein
MPHDVPGGLVLPLTLIRDLPQQVVLGPSQVGDDFHDTSGRTQCSRDIFSCEPKIRSDSMVVGNPLQRSERHSERNTATAKRQDEGNPEDQESEQSDDAFH